MIPWRRIKHDKCEVNAERTDRQICLSRQALELLRELHSYTGGGKMLFRDNRESERPMTYMALLVGLERRKSIGDITGASAARAST